MVYASLHIISRPGYELLINQSIEKAKYFADLIDQHPDFELISQPELCLLTYRYVPQAVQGKVKQWPMAEQQFATEEHKTAAMIDGRID